MVWKFKHHGLRDLVQTHPVRRDQWKGIVENLKLNLMS